MSSSAPTPDHPALLLVDHGSVRAEANASLEEVAALVRAIAPGWHVATAHMELAPPTIAEGLATCADAGATDVVVVPYMLAAGRHSREDIPRIVAEAAADHPGVRVRVSEPLGVDRRIAEVVFARALETDGGSPRSLPPR